MGPSPPCCSPRTTEPSDPAEPWGLVITPPGLPRLAHHARADASRSTAFRDPCAALASPGRSGGVVRHPCHGSPSLPRSARPRADRAPVPDPRGFRSSAEHSRPAAAGALPRSRGAHQQPASLRSPRRDPDLAANNRLATRSVAAMAPAAICLDERAWRLSIRPRSSISRAPSVPCRG